jgi:fucose 4-O-acetylase-like acetyltransferase
MTESKQGRLEWVDYAKGVGMFLVVLGHTLRGLEASDVIADGPTFRFVDSWIYSFHMPLFFALSGFFAERQVKRNMSVFLQEKLATLAYPYLLWSTLQALLQMAAGGYTNHQANLSEISTILITPILEFWFLYALFLISMIYYVLRRLGIGSLAVVVTFGILMVAVRSVPLKLNWPILLVAINNGIYYAFGAASNNHGATSTGLARFPELAVMIVGYGIVTAWALTSHPQLKVMSVAVALCGSLASVALAITLSRIRGFDVVRLIGLYSLEIYVAHTIVSGGLRIFLQKILRVQDGMTYIVIVTVGGVFLPMALGMLCRRYHAEFVFRFPRRHAIRTT